MDDTTPPRLRRFHLTPGHCLLALLAVEFLLFLSQWFRWLPKGWPVLIAVAAVGLVVLGMVAVVRRGPGLSAAIPVQPPVAAGAGRRRGFAV